MPFRLSFLIRTFSIIAPELIGMVGDVLLVVMSDPLVFGLTTTPSAVVHILQTAPFALPDLVIAFGDFERVSLNFGDLRGSAR